MLQSLLEWLRLRITRHIEIVRGILTVFEPFNSVIPHEHCFADSARANNECVEACLNEPVEQICISDPVRSQPVVMEEYTLML